MSASHRPGVAMLPQRKLQSVSIHSASPYAGFTSQRRPLPHFPSASASASASPSPSADQLPPRFRASLTHIPPTPITQRIPTLVSRKLYVNPLHTIAGALQSLFTQLDSSTAQTLDRVKPALLAATVLATMAAPLGLHPFQQLQHGIPEAVLALFENVMGYEFSVIYQLVMMVVAAPLALLQFRNWWAVHTTSIRDLVGAQTDSRGSTSPVSLTAASVAFFTAAIRLVLLSTAAWTLAGPSSKTAWLVAGVLYATSLASLFLGVSWGKDMVSEAAADAESDSAPSQDSSWSAALMLGTAVTADAIFLALLAAAPNAAREVGLLSPVTLLTLAAVQAACVTTAPLQALFNDRLNSLQAGPGMEVEVHVSMAVPDSGSVLDTTQGMQPLRVKVAQAAESLGIMDEPSTSTSNTATWSLENSHSDHSSLERFRTPQIADALDKVLPGMLVGEKRSTLFFNPSISEGGYADPRLTWWQPREDFDGKFKGGAQPQDSQTFLYPLGIDGSFADVRVNGIARDHVELDGNVNFENSRVLMHVKLVRIMSPSAR